MLNKGLKNRRIGRRRYFDTEDVNPMEGAVNIVDAMLVFACGLMLSLVIYWNVDLRNKDLVPVNKGDEMTQVEGLKNQMEAGDGEADLYEKLGTVYIDPHTGKMYLVQDAGDSTTVTDSAISEDK